MDELELTTTYDKAPLIEAMKTSMQQKGKEYKEAELYNDKTWIEASSLVYKMKEGKDFQGYTEDLAQYGIDKMSEFNYNVSFGMVPDVLDVEDADHDTQVAFAYMMDTYDKKDVTIDGFGRAIKELALDPTSYIGIGTLGAGFAMRKTGAELAKEGIKNRLMAKISSYLTNEVAIGATEGALYTAGDEIARESVYQDAGMMDGYSPENIAIAGGLGAVAGGGIVKGIKMVGKGIDMANKAGEEAMAISAGGGTPEMMKLYHGTNAEFEKFDRVGDKLTSIGAGHYFSPDKNTALQYGKNIKELDIPKAMVLDLDNPTSEQKSKIIELLDEVVPEDVKAGFGGVQKKYFKDPDTMTDEERKEAIAFFNQKKDETAGYYHDRAKAKLDHDEKGTFVQWGTPGLEGASVSNLKNLLQEYRQSIPKELGFKAAKSGDEVAIYDTDLVNTSLKKETTGGGTPPKMTVEEKAKEVKNRLGLKDFSVYEHGNDVKLTMFEVPKENRKQGKGSQAMEELTKSADENGKRIVLTTGLRDELHGTTSKARLVKFYKRFGFVENKGKNKDWSISENMYREPQGATK